MNLKLFFVTPFLILFLKTGSAQNLEGTNRSSNPSLGSFLDRTEFKASYFGNVFWNNGLSFGSEYLLKEITKEKNRKRGKRTNKHQFLLNGNLGFTTNFSTKTDTGLFTNYGITWRRTNKKGKQFSIEFNPLGYYRSFLPDTYKVSGDNVKKVSLPGRGYYTPSISFGIGKERKGKKISGRFFNVNFMMRTNYNAGVSPIVNFQYGYRFNFKKKKRHAKDN